MNEKTQNRFKWIFTIIVLAGSLGFTAWLMFRGASETEFTIQKETNQLSIEVMYRQEITIDGSTQINLISPLEIERRTNGSAIGDSKKGYFTLEGDLAVYLNLNDATLDWIEIINQDTYYYINTSIEADTTSLYDALIALQSQID